MQSELICYKTMPVWDKATIPAAVFRSTTHKLVLTASCAYYVGG